MMESWRRMRRFGYSVSKGSLLVWRGEDFVSLRILSDRQPSAGRPSFCASSDSEMAASAQNASKSALARAGAALLAVPRPAANDSFTEECRTLVGIE